MEKLGISVGGVVTIERSKSKITVTFFLFLQIKENAYSESHRVEEVSQLGSLDSGDKSQGRRPQPEGKRR